MNSSIGELSAIYICMHGYATYSSIVEISAISICGRVYAMYSSIGGLTLSSFYMCGPTSYKLVDRRAVGL